MNETIEKTPSKLSKKEARKIVYEKFAGALAEYRADLKEKKFDSNLKKASKLFAADIAKAFAKQRQRIKKPTKIKMVKNPLPEKETGAEAIG
jgi:hypothetical protein